MAKCGPELTIYSLACSRLSKLSEKNLLNCTSCEKLLEPPVFLVSNVGNVCCQCKNSNNYTGTRNEIFDIIHKRLPIPCSYTAIGCTEQFASAEDFDSHLSTCKFRPAVLCPSHKRCTWTGRLEDLAAHFEEEHIEDVISKNKFAVEFDLRSPSLTLMIKRKLTYFLIIKHDKETDEILLESYACHPGFELKVELSTKSLLRKQTLTFEIVTKQLNFINGNICDHKMSISALKSFAGKSHLLNLTAESSRFSLRPTDGRLLLLKCFNCWEMLKVPIYECETGHTICSTCSEYNKCKICSGVVEKTIRNYDLENVADKLFYPCTYEAEGCNAVHLGSEILHHEFECAYHPYKCPVNDCGYMYNSKNASLHLMSQHKTVAINKFEFRWQPFSAERNATYRNRLIYIDGCLYCCDFYGRADVTNKKFDCPYFKLRKLNGNKKLNNMWCRMALKDLETQFEASQVQKIFEPYQTGDYTLVLVLYKGFPSSIAADLLVTFEFFLD